MIIKPISFPSQFKIEVISRLTTKTISHLKFKVSQCGKLEVQSKMLLQMMKAFFPSDFALSLSQAINIVIIIISIIFINTVTVIFIIIIIFRKILQKSFSLAFHFFPRTFGKYLQNVTQKSTRDTCDL